MLVFEGDLLKGHKIIGQEDVMDTSNRHVILRMITELKNKLQTGSRFIGEKGDKKVDLQAEYAQGSQGDQKLLRANASTRLPTPERHHLNPGSAFKFPDG